MPKPAKTFADYPHPDAPGFSFRLIVKRNRRNPNYAEQENAPCFLGKPLSESNRWPAADRAACAGVAVRHFEKVHGKHITRLTSLMHKRATADTMRRAQIAADTSRRAIAEWFVVESAALREWERERKGAKK